MRLSHTIKTLLLMLTLTLFPFSSFAGGNQAIATAYKNRTSDVQVGGSGVVAKVLPDDNKGSRHQRFILRLSTGHTILIAHNIDLAPKYCH
jgi:hypothetical protein